MIGTSLTHTETGRASSRRRQRRHRPVGDMANWGPVIVPPQPNTLYEEEPDRLPNVFEMYSQFFSISDQNLVAYTLHGSPTILLPSSETGDVPPLTASQEQMDCSSALSAGRSVPDFEAIHDHWIRIVETCPPGLAGINRFDSGRHYQDYLDEASGHCESITAPLAEYVFHSSAGGKTKDTNASPVLATLQSASPEAVERIRKLADLEPNWDGYGGSPPTEQAVKATAALLLETNKLSRGLLEEPFIAPLPEGGLELEWELDSGAELMLVIPPTGIDVRYLLDEPMISGDINESEGVVSKDATLSELINQLTR